MFRKTRRLPLVHHAEKLADRLSPVERTIFTSIIAALSLSVLGLLLRVNSLTLTEVPVRGGAVREGVVGTARFVNPLFASSDADRDLVTLIYSGLLKPDARGRLVPDLAESFEVSNDGLDYTFTLREDVTFHDGKRVTADDVVFTVVLAQNPRLKSPKRANWEGIAATALNDRQIRFTLPKPYAPFLENATLGILPKHLFQEADPEAHAFSPYNVEPVGSGPYEIKKVKKNAAGVPLAYVLKPFSGYSGTEPYIAELTMQLYPNETALVAAFNRGEIDSMNAITPARLAEIAGRPGIRIVTAPLPRVFGVFFNQNQMPIFADKDVREGLFAAIDREALVRRVLHGYGTPVVGPVPPGTIPNMRRTGRQVSSAGAAAATSTHETPVERARAIIAQGGWKYDEAEAVFKKRGKATTTTLAFSLATSDAPELKAVAEIVRETWEAVGARVDLQIFESGDLAQNVIRPRRFDSLLFGEMVGRDLDLFAFWHSSQRNDPGLNVALYANVTADKLLEEARTITDIDKRYASYRAFEDEIAKDIPAVFLYAPDFIYVVPANVHGLELGKIMTGSDRFLGVSSWYTETERVWPFFVPNNS